MARFVNAVEETGCERLNLVRVDPSDSKDSGEAQKSKLKRVGLRKGDEAAAQLKDLDHFTLQGDRGRWKEHYNKLGRSSRATWRVPSAA